MDWAGVKEGVQGEECVRPLPTRRSQPWHGGFASLLRLELGAARSTWSIACAHGRPAPKRRARTSKEVRALQRVGL